MTLTNNTIKAGIIKELVENYGWKRDEIVSINKKGDYFKIKSIGHFNDYDEFFYEFAGHFYLKTVAGTKKYSMRPKLLIA